MRRAMLTQVGGGLPFIVGENPVPASSFTSTANSLVVSTANPAPRAGTITSVTVRSGGTGAFTVLTGALNTGTGTFVVTGSSASVTPTSGLGTYTVSVPINAGDVVGIWTTATTSVQAASGLGTRWLKTSVTTLPSGTVTGLSTNANAECLQAGGA